MMLINCTGGAIEQSHVRPKYSPWPDLTKFTIASKLSPQQLTDTLYALFQQHPVLREALPCRRYGAGNALFTCSKVIREDVFNAMFEPDSKILTFMISPRTFDSSYKPDYRHFQYLRNEIEQMLIAHFGKANIAIE